MLSQLNLFSKALSPSFVFIIVHRSGRPASRKRGRPGSIHNVSGREVDIGDRDQYISMSSVLNLKASFLPLKTSSFDHTKV